MQHQHLDRDPTNGQRGFTLVEVVIALVILGGSLVVLLGLQSSLITRTLRDETQERASLLTRQLLAPLEAGLSSTDTIDTSGTFQEVYARVTKDLAQPSDLDSTDNNAMFRVSYTIVPWKIEGFDDDLMHKVTVIVSWGENPSDRTITNYFVPVIQ